MRTWAAGGNSPISSRNNVPPSARSNQPRRASTAPVNAPRSWPKSCESISSGGIAPQFTRSNGPLRRDERLWIARAISSLPVPVSPKISTGASLRATNSTRSITACSPDSTPTIVSPSVLRPSRVNSERLSASAASRSAAISRSRRSLSKATEIGSNSSCTSSGVRGERAAVGREQNQHAAVAGRIAQGPDRYVAVVLIRGQRASNRPAADSSPRRCDTFPRRHHSNSDCNSAGEQLVRASRRCRLGFGEIGSNRFQPRSHRVDATDQHLLDRDMTGQHGGDVRQSIGRSRYAGRPLARRSGVSAGTAPFARNDFNIGNGCHEIQRLYYHISRPVSMVFHGLRPCRSAIVPIRRQSSHASQFRNAARELRR